MNPALEVFRPRTIEDAACLLARHTDARLLAGGQSLIAAMKTGLSDPSHLVDLRGLISAHPELDEIRDEGDALWIGALVTHHRIASSPVVARHMPMLSQLAAGIADPQIRNRGTIGGSVALHDPAACWPAGVLASSAWVKTQRREIPADDFFTGIYGTSLASNEIILGLRFPTGRRGVYLKHEQKASRFALVGAAVTVALPDQSNEVLADDHDDLPYAIKSRSGRGQTEGNGAPTPPVRGIRIAITGLGNGVRRWAEAEARLDADFSPETLLAIELPADDAGSDLHASARYRANLARVLAIRAVAMLTGRPAPPAPPNDSLRSRPRP
jgi:carbon-monoxide dehydrogenase medium subunit